jgi:hypothetical protein
MARPLLILLALCAASVPAFACGDSQALDGALAIPSCDSEEGGRCRLAAEVAYDYLETLKISGVFTIGAQSSPWRIYDGNDRIVTIDEVAAMVRAQRAEQTGVYLVGSWTARLPGGGDDTLAQRLSAALDGFPVDGTDGFLWLTADGGMRTTRQAFSVWASGPYYVGEREDVMAAMIPGAMAQFEDRFADDGLANGVLRAGVGHDVLGLCPERALAAFERAGAMGSSIGAYNAGMMHDRNGDREKAIAALELAVMLGDEKAGARLAMLQEIGAAPESKDGLRNEAHRQCQKRWASFLSPSYDPGGSNTVWCGRISHPT